MELDNLSTKYTVKAIQDNDIPIVYTLCKKNPQYYHFCPPEVTTEGIAKDMRALPPGKTMEDKYYIGFWQEDILVAVMDLIVAFPNKETAFIGFFMMNADLQGKGIGSSIIADVSVCLKKYYKYIRLGYVNGNAQPEHFWKKNGFLPTGVIAKEELYDVVVLERKL